MKIKKVLVVCKKGTIDYYRDLSKGSKKEAELRLKENFNVNNIKKSHKKHEKTISEIHKVLSNYDVEIEAICRTDLDENSIESSDLIIPVGGDGIILRAAHLIKDKPVMAVNSNVESSEGVLTQYNKNNFSEGFKQIIKDKAELTEVTRISAFLNRKNVGEALNEIFVGINNAYHIARYNINHKGKEEKQKSSGIITSTGAGSTAWYKSAGGTPFEKKSKQAKFIVREPYQGRLNNPTIITGEFDEKESLIIESEMFGGIIAIDSIREFKFEPGNKVEIKISEHPLKMYSMKKKVIKCTK